MYTVKMIRTQSFTSQVYVDTFNTESFGLAIRMFSYLWGQHFELKSDHREIWVQMLDECGNIVKEDRWAFPGKLPKWMTLGGQVK